ncbi:ferredoxin [Actinomadura kijaniata]|uniref:ferredoxin n=1 Tax=Actinomadura kijaniata TaxID=46161 RepID=UPI003F1ADA78
MRVHVDLDLCQGHAVCELEAPDVFEVPPKGRVRVLADPTEDQRDEVLAAVRFCPTRALRLEA